RKPMLGEPIGEPRGEPPYKALINNDNGGPGGTRLKVGNHGYVKIRLMQSNSVSKRGLQLIPAACNVLRLATRPDRFGHQALHHRDASALADEAA
ncbi:hypothetical protein EN759_21370, partial [Mesorhizobium sp. M00.F.Ca.ET.038.03.1.1]